MVLIGIISNIVLINKQPSIRIVSFSIYLFTNLIICRFIQYIFLLYMFPNNRELSWSNWFVISKRTSYRKSCQANDTCYENHHSLLFSFLWWWVLPLEDWCVFPIFSICMEACDDHIFTFAVEHPQWFIHFPKFNISWMCNRNPYLHSMINQGIYIYNTINPCT